MAKLIISLEDIRSGVYASHMKHRLDVLDAFSEFVGIGMPWEPTTDSCNDFEGNPKHQEGCPYCGSYEGDYQECPECGHGQ